MKGVTAIKHDAAYVLCMRIVETDPCGALAWQPEEVLGNKHLCSCCV